MALIAEAKKSALSAEALAAKAAAAKIERKRLDKIKRLEAQLALLKA